MSKRNLEQAKAGIGTALARKASSSRLRPGALILTDDADESPDHVARVRPKTAGYMSEQLAADIELSMRLG